MHGLTLHLLSCQIYQNQLPNCWRVTFEGFFLKKTRMSNLIAKPLKLLLKIGGGLYFKINIENANGQDNENANVHVAL